jgi:beta-xylosidase
MVEAVMFWNEPNNKSHWDQQIDPEWRQFAEMVKVAARAVAAENDQITRVLGGMSPIDAGWIKRMEDFGVLETLNAVAVHGFPLDWNNWMLDEWPARLREIQAVTDLPVWVSEVGISTFGAEEVQEFGLQRTAELLIGRAPRIHWYSLYDLPSAWPATTRHREAEGSSYYRHFHMGLLREDGTPKLALQHFERTGLSWADSFRPNADAWFDRQMAALEEFDVTVTYCFTPEHRGPGAHHTSPPYVNEEFAEFCARMTRRYAPQKAAAISV